MVLVKVWTMEDPDTPIRRASSVISAFGPSSLTTIENLNEEKNNKNKNESLKTANDALRTRVCYVSQVVLFLVALVSLTIGLTVGYNKDETAGSNNQAEDSEALVSECPFDVAGKILKFILLRSKLILLGGKIVPLSWKLFELLTKVLLLSCKMILLGGKMIY